MATHALFLSNATARIATAIKRWWREWSASQDEAASHAFARDIDPITGRPITSRPQFRRYY